MLATPNKVHHHCWYHTVWSGMQVCQVSLVCVLFFKLSVNVCIGEVTPHCTRIEKITDQPSPVCLGEKKKESNLSVLRLFSVLISEIISDVLKQFCHPGNCIFIACGGTRTWKTPSFKLKPIFEKLLFENNSSNYFLSFSSSNKNKGK